jgi:hypothetical protein
MAKLKLVPAVIGACLLGLLGGTLVANATAGITSPETFSVGFDITKTRFVDMGGK